MHAFLRPLFVLSLFGGLSHCDKSYDIGSVNLSVGCSKDADCEDGATCDFAARSCRPRPSTHNVDVLFLIDNSDSMVGKQEALLSRMSSFLQRLDDAGADYHIGIATSDIGSWTSPASPWPLPGSTCDSFAGDDGLLQAIPCTSRTGGSSAAQKACASLCPDGRFVPTDGKPYLSKVHGVTNVPTDWGIDAATGKRIDRGPQRALSCMGFVGDGGCGIEGQFEGAKRALDGHRSENAGFLRSDSMLAVIFLTDEDDCSVKMSARNENNPAVIDCSTPDSNAAYNCFNADYRCMARNVECDQPLNTPGLKTHCHERATSYLESENTYVSFLSSLRPANRLFIGGIWSITPIDNPLGSGNPLYAEYFPSDVMESPVLNRKPVGCTVTPEGEGLLTYPQLRLSKFARSFSSYQETDLCLTDSYATSLDNMAKTILHQAGL